MLQRLLLIFIHFQPFHAFIIEVLEIQNEIKNIVFTSNLEGFHTFIVFDLWLFGLHARYVSVIYNINKILIDHNQAL